jgi:hypothetical protein
MAIRIAIAVIFVSVFATSNSAVALVDGTGNVQELVICKSPGKSAEPFFGKSATAGKSVRTLRFYDTKDKTESGEIMDGCRATYSKDNVEKTVGTSRQAQHCRSILSGIKKNLEASHWTCREVGTFAMLKTNAAESSEALAKNTSDSGTERKADTKSAEKSVVQ